ncbi:MAG: flagellar brake protein [Pseudomonadota bacterium]
MPQKKEAGLGVERFHNDEDSDFRISSRKEMRSILQRIAAQHARAVLYFDGGQCFILTTLLEVSDAGIWLDVGPSDEENRRLLLSRDITFVSSHQAVKVQFTAHAIEQVVWDGRPAFYLALPDFLLRIQRRENFRISIPPGEPIRCRIPTLAYNVGKSAMEMREVTVLDISCGGIGLLCAENETDLITGLMLPECQITLPQTGSFTVTLRVLGELEFNAGEQTVHRRAGCQFVRPGAQNDALLQRYITYLQSITRA